MRYKENPKILKLEPTVVWFLHGRSESNAATSALLNSKKLNPNTVCSRVDRQRVNLEPTVVRFLLNVDILQNKTRIKRGIVTLSGDVQSLIFNLLACNDVIRGDERREGN
ncbi:hypothetical protein R6Q59_016402 [Mikania micrantha]